MIFLPVIFPLFCPGAFAFAAEKKGGWYAVLLAGKAMLSIQLGLATLLFHFLPGRSAYTRERRKPHQKKWGAWELIPDWNLYFGGGSALVAILLLQSPRSGENLSYFGVMKRHGLDDFV